MNHVNCSQCGHFILMGITLIAIIVALKKTENKNAKEVHNIIKKLTIIIWTLEIIKIIISIAQNSIYALNTYLPLYYCSMLLYAGLMSSFGKGKIKRMGDVFLATGGIIGGIVFIIFPTTSLPTYPTFHFFSIHSFFFHGTMIYLGLLMNKTGYITIKLEDIKYFCSLVGTLCIIALFINEKYNMNFMFISQNFPIAPIEILYKLTNGTVWFNIIMSAVQMTAPFYIGYYLNKKYNKCKNENLNNEEKLLTC